MADKSLIGRSLGVTTAEVEKGRLRFFAKAIGETNPVYSDEAAAKAAGYKSLPVPPTFLFCLQGEGRDLGEFLALLQWDLGRILHAEQEFSYHKPAVAGDVLTFDTRVADVYEKKGGALQFVVQDTRVTNQDGEHIADLRCSLVQR
ncbi:MaoC family dehydratase [Pseudomonas aeruginosa]|uniref:Acyl dehydratase n=1 Tax=Pseudomonas jinjuensis TaxID=198616 RepID=A0A1H0F1X6_9PSED|nr:MULTISPECIES: MaoC family dehydratase N-terminal domain-containing protein [Pseudomonas aeruginosa group]ELK4918990.1 MaoC family dehydratase N-terminal domain-containing protein [Pseudomonas aeruginosa]MCS8548621.1 MaoC family dehydratase N-terminal domain-containing protein [Pseudomonas aeruginosa]MCT1238810.1 MaoC family dehydratase N-terminal domain-containing protein [Pseudomonas aeruginosa]MDA3425410.1 MaoC family dehydratase [Pseudomonas aeruginosa]PWU34486.1 MaoC family dehydratase 